MELSQKDAEDLLVFLARVQIAGNEALRLVQLQQTLLKGTQINNPALAPKKEDKKEEKK